MCHFWNHKYSKWIVTFSGDTYRILDGLGLPIEPKEMRKHVIGKYEVQRRECSVCGKSQMREVRS